MTVFLLLFFSFLSSTFTEKMDYPSFQEIVLNSNYNRLISPYERTRKRMDMFVSVPFIILVSVDESQQIVSYIAAVNISWYDPRLKFDPKELGYEWIIVPSMLLWIPSLEPFNTVELKFLDRETPSNDALVSSTGWASMLVKGKYDTVCRFDVSGFPFDLQFCNLNFEVGIYDANMAMLLPGPKTDLIMGLPEWNIYNPVINSTFYTTNDGKNFSMAIVSFKFVRNPQFYVYLLILPTMIITITCLGALLLPLGIDEGERANIGIAGMLGLTFMLSIIVIQVPRSKKLPLMAKWLIVQLFYCIVAMIWEVPLAFVRCSLVRRLVASKRIPTRWEDKIPTFLAALSAFVFIASDLLMTIIWFNNPPQPNRMDGKLV